jgi:cysteine desulfurase
MNCLLVLFPIENNNSLQYLYLYKIEPMVNEYIYLDNNSTTRVDDRAIESMIPFFSNYYANPASNHSFGVEVNQAIKESRKRIADFISTDPHEIIFTAGATESINIAIQGLAYQSSKKHIITCKTEHHAVLDTCKFLETKGYRVTYLSVDSLGMIDLSELESIIEQDTFLVSIMYVNNETGVIQPIQKISELCHSKGVPFMCDATQGFGKIPINVYQDGIDLLTFSGHKFHAPKGIGGLFLRNKKPFKIKVNPINFGGGHERNIRSGTLNVPSIVGIGKAVEIAQKEMVSNSNNVQLLRNFLESELLQIDGSHINGSIRDRIYNTLSIRFDGIDADAMIIGLKPIIVSNGSACTSTLVEPSHVLMSMGLSEKEAYSTLRFSLSKYTTKEEIQKTVIKVKQVVEELRGM